MMKLPFHTTDRFTGRSLMSLPSYEYCGHYAERSGQNPSGQIRACVPLLTTFGNEWLVVSLVGQSLGALPVQSGISNLEPDTQEKHLATN